MERELTPAVEMATKDDSKKRAGFLFHTVSKYELKPGDHIYAYRAAGVYAHHGIYIGEPGMEVIHFSGQTSKLKRNIYIRSCTYEEFKGYALFVRLVAYDVNPVAHFFKRKLTAHRYESRPAKDVVKTAKYFLEHPKSFGKYNILFNNCETFAIYCKTEMALPSSQVIPFQSILEGLLVAEDDDDDDYFTMAMMTMDDMGYTAFDFVEF